MLIRRNVVLRACVCVADERTAHAAVEVGGKPVHDMCTAAAETCCASFGGGSIHHSRSPVIERLSRITVWLTYISV